MKLIFTAFTGSRGDIVALSAPRIFARFPRTTELSRTGCVNETLPCFYSNFAGAADYCATFLIVFMDFLFFVVDNEVKVILPAGVVTFPILLVLCISILPNMSPIDAVFLSYCVTNKMTSGGDFSIGIGWTIRIVVDAGDFTGQFVFDGDGVGNQANEFDDPDNPVAFGDASGHWLGGDWRRFGGVEDLRVDGEEAGDGDGASGRYGNDCRFPVPAI